MENNQDQSNTQQVSGTSENVITTPQTNLLQTYIQSHENTNNPKTSEEVTRTGKHDASGHCQQVVHVSSHTRNGHQVNAYDRLCGQNHTKKEAEEKNQEEKDKAKEIMQNDDEPEMA